jgi:hypothetical protein
LIGKKRCEKHLFFYPFFLKYINAITTPATPKTTPPTTNPFLVVLQLFQPFSVVVSDDFFLTSSFIGSTSVTKFFEAQDDAFRKKKFARQFIVMQFFNKIKNVSELISYIKLEHFKTK